MSFNIETATLQEACDYAVKKIVEQGDRCVDDNDSCFYKKEDKRCAVGWLLPDDTPIEVFKCEENVEGLVGFNCIPKFIKDYRSFLGRLQEFHDCQSKYKREEILRNMSEKIDISPPQYKQWVEMGLTVI